MADATIKQIHPLLNIVKGGGKKCYTFAIEGTNLDKNTKVVVKWFGEPLDVVTKEHGSGNKLLLVTAKRKPSAMPPKGWKPYQVDEITVTVANGMQTPVPPTDKQFVVSHDDT